MRSNWLLDSGDNVYSQHGEDGIIGKIPSIIPERDRWCVEFGAWDGIYLSNVRNLIENDQYSAVLIEAAKERAVQLKNNYAEKDRVITLNKEVGFSADDNLDSILEVLTVPYDFDFLSIDVDGNDYHIWKAVSKYHPKVVCIEFNPTIPTEVRFIQKADKTVSQGASLLSLVELGRDKGYELVAVTVCNAIFVWREYFPLFMIEDNAPSSLRSSCEYVTYLFSGYDGSLMLQGHQRLPWHGVMLYESRFQQIPRWLQKYPGTYSKIENLAFKLFRWGHLIVNSPNLTTKAISRLRRRFIKAANDAITK